MEMSYLLNPKNIFYRIEDHFPKLLNDKKMGIFLSGGMESSLITLIAQQVYGKNKVLNFFSDNIFSSNNPVKNNYIHTNLKKISTLLDITPIYLDFNYDEFITDRKYSIEKKIKNLETEYNVQFIMFGLTKLFFEVEPFKQDNMTFEKIKEIAYTDPLKFKATIEEFHLETDEYVEELLNIDISKEVYHLLRETSGFIQSPFNILYKSEIVDFYRQLNCLEILYKTTSCIRETLTYTGKHCGECYNCQNRHDAFRILGTVDDQTEYVSDKIIKLRNKLERIRNVIHPQYY